MNKINDRALIRTLVTIKDGTERHEGMNTIWEGGTVPSEQLLDKLELHWYNSGRLVVMNRETGEAHFQMHFGNMMIVTCNDPSHKWQISYKGPTIGFEVFENDVKTPVNMDISGGSMLSYEDKYGTLKGHVKMEMYEGDIRRERIPLRQRLWNAFANARWKLLHIPASHYYWGKVLNKKVGEWQGSNLIVTIGKQMALDRLFGLSSIAALSHMGVGTDSTAAAVGNTKLNPSVSGSVSFLAYDATPIRTSLTVAAIRTWDTATGNFSWNELGLANSATNDGTHLFNRIIVGPFAKSSAVSIIVTVSISLS